MNKQTRARILILDDEQLVRNSLADYLQDAGFKTVCFASGEEAIETLGSERFDVAVVDMRMPGMNGNQFIEKALLLAPGLRYIVHTGSISYSLPMSLVEGGVLPEHVFIKPVENFADIEAAILEHLKGGGA